MISPMNGLERFHACMNYEPVDHTPFWSWGGWPETIERWEKEGYDEKTSLLLLVSNESPYLFNTYLGNISAETFNPLRQVERYPTGPNLGRV